MRWRAQAGKVLEKWQAEDTIARAEPLNVPLASLLAEFRLDPAAAEANYQQKWLVVTGKVTKVTREPIYELSADGSVSSIMAPSMPTRTPRADVMALTIKIVDKSSKDDALDCHCVIETRAVPAGAGAAAKSLAGIKEGGTVTILGRWLSPFYTAIPGVSFSRTSCALAQCELAK